MNAVPMSRATAEDLAIAKALAQRSELPEGFDPRCVGPGCENHLRKPRYLKSEHGVRYITWCFCSQECHDAYLGQFRGAPPHWEKYDQEGVLIGFVVQGKGFVPLEAIDREEGAP